MLLQLYCIHSVRGVKTGVFGNACRVNGIRMERGFEQLYSTTDIQKRVQNISKLNAERNWRMKVALKDILLMEIEML